MNNRRKLKTFIFLVFFLIVVFSVTSCSRKPAKIRIGYQPITLNLPLFVALEKGYFNESGLQIEAIPFTSSDQLTNSLLAGNIDIGASASTSSFMSTNEENIGFAKIFMVCIHTPTNYLDALLVKRGSSIRKIPDLKSKKIGMFPGSTNVIYLSIALNNYIDPKSDVEMIQLPPQTHIDALVSGQIDALYTLEPLVTVALANGIGEILIQGSNSTYIVNPFPGGVYVISKDFYENNNSDSRKAINAIYRGVDFIRNNEIEARKYYDKYTPIKGDIALKTHIGEWWKIDEIQKDKIQKLADVLLDNKILKKKVESSNFYLR